VEETLKAGGDDEDGGQYQEAAGRLEGVVKQGC